MVTGSSIDKKELSVSTTPTTTMTALRHITGKPIKMQLQISISTSREPHLK